MAVFFLRRGSILNSQMQLGPQEDKEEEQSEEEVLGICSCSEHSLLLVYWRNHISLLGPSRSSHHEIRSLDGLLPDSNLPSPARLAHAFQQSMLQALHEGARGELGGEALQFVCARKRQR